MKDKYKQASLDREKRKERAVYWLHDQGGSATVAEFDAHHAPHGPEIRAKMIKDRLTHEEDSTVTLFPPTPTAG